MSLEFKFWCVITIILYLFVILILQIYYRLGKNTEDQDNVKLLNGLLWVTPIVPVLFPMAIVMFASYGILYLMFLTPTKGAKKNKLPELSFEDIYRQEKQSQKIKIVEPSKPKIKPCEGFKPSFKDSFKDTENK